MAKEGRNFASILEEWQRLSDQLDNDPENCPQEIANEYFRMANAVAKQFQKAANLTPKQLEDLGGALGTFIMMARKNEEAQ